jgi:hypothetical protein
MDGKIKSVKLGINLFNPAFNSSELYKCEVSRENEFETNQVYRTFDEFCELYQLLVKVFPVLRLQNTPPLSKFKDAKNIPKRRQYIESLIQDILHLQPEISHVNILNIKTSFLKCFLL